ncbi:MAG: hypothetical protein VX346_28510 [Planctomycetota bacterium]|nr:hypothetical protein [Planctomycetota bacterium]
MLRYAPLLWFLVATTVPAAGPPPRPPRLYHWPYLKFTRYVDALGVDCPQGDIDPRRAFYWGRVLGCDGIAINIRGLTPSLHEGNWFEPIYQTPAEKKYVFDLMRRFQRLYASYGCADNFLHLHAHPLLKHHPTHIPGDVAQWRKWVIAGMRQRGELLHHMDIQRILIDLEFADQKNVSTDETFWYALGREIARVLVQAHPTIRIGFYPDLYYHMHQPSTGPYVFGRVRAGDLRHALLAGLYAGRGERPLWDFVGYTYTIVDGAIAEPGVEYVWDLAEHLKRLIEVHHRGLGPAVEFMPGRWELGASHAPAALFGGLFKQPNLSIAMLRRDYSVLLAQTKSIGIWDHGYAWDPAGAGYKRFATDADLAAWKTSLAGLALRSHYHEHLQSQDRWHMHVPADTPLAEKLQYFQIVKAGDGAWLVSGRLAPDFNRYVNLTRELLGKDRLAFPLHSSQDLERARRWHQQGFFAGQSIRTAPDRRWPQAVATMAPRSRP